MSKQKYIDLIDFNELNNFKKIVLVTGKESFKKNKFALNILDNFHDKITHLKKDNLPTDISYVHRTLSQNNIKDINCIISIGGGNVIDFAKALIYFSNSKTKYFLCIPTTCGSGSESTNFFVIYENRLKKSLSSKIVLPSSILLDYSNLLGLDRKILISSYIDALSQSMESFWSKNSTNESKELSLRALKHLIRAKTNLINYKKRSLQDAQIGSNLAGKAINISKTTAPHAFSYYFNQYNIPHGIAVNITTPFFMKYIFSKASNKLEEDLNNLSYNLIKKDFNYFIDFYKSILKSLGDESINEFKKIKNFNFENFYNSVNKERLKNTPVKISKQFLKNYLDAL